MNQGQLDELDLRILAGLQDDGRRAYREIAKELDVAPATVRTRLLQLIDEEVVEVVAVPNLWRMGLGFIATVGISLEPGHVDEAANLLARREEVTWVAINVTGRYEILCEVALRDAPEFAKFRAHVLPDVPGYRDADVYLMSETRKLRYRVQGSNHGLGRVTLPADAGADRTDSG